MKLPIRPAPSIWIAFALALVLSAPGCALSQLQTTAGGKEYVPKSLIPKASFDHACSVDRVFLIRGTGLDSGSALSTWDLEICGKVRRYECYFQERVGFGCRDKTADYPEEVLPHATAAPSPVGAGRP